MESRFLDIELQQQRKFMWYSFAKFHVVSRPVARQGTDGDGGGGADGLRGGNFQCVKLC